MFWKEPKVSFVSMVDGIAETFPITRSEINKRVWANNVRKQMSEINKSENLRFQHIARCPGINSIMSTGWTQQAWQDIFIQPTADGNFQWQTPISQKSLDNDISVGEYVDFHENTYAKAINDDSVINQVVKIQSPWVAYIPKGYSLICMPVAYADTSNYEAAVGLFSSAGNLPVQLSVQLVFRKKEEPTLIKAGDPLCQYFLVKDKQVNFEVRSANSKDKQRYKAAYIFARGKFINIPNIFRGL